MNPVVAVTTWRRRSDTYLGPDTAIFTLVDDYSEALERAGATALLIARLQSDQVDDLLDRVDGLVLTGGGDIHPERYGHHNTDSEDMDDSADVRDIALARGAKARGLPVLGICRGHQVMNVAFGGALRQHALTDGADAHPTLSDDSMERNAWRHVVEIDPASRLAEVYGVIERKVNSLHHQSVEILGEDMMAVAWSSDGQIEASESTSAWPVMCVQWHPEMLHDEAEDRLFSAFVEDACAYATR